MTDSIPATQKRQYLFIALLAGFLIAIWIASNVFGKLSGNSDQPDGYALAGNCDLRVEACHVSIEGINLTLDVEPKQIQSLMPLSYKVTLTGADVTDMVLDLQGLDMFMGLNQTRLSPVAGQAGVFQGQGELGVCTTGEMTWRATLIAETDKGQIRTWFDFPAK